MLQDVLYPYIGNYNDGSDDCDSWFQVVESLSDEHYYYYLSVALQCM